MNQQLISVIMPSYNSEQFIAEAIESVRAQTYPHWELLITDDCSTDNTVEIVKQYVVKDARIKLFRLEQNSGAGVARNKSIEAATGRYIALLDSDDMWKPQKLERQIDFMTKNRYQFVCSQCEIMDVKGKIIGHFRYSGKISYVKTLFVSYIATSSIIYDTRFAGKIYMQNIRKRQDWLWCLEILKKTKYAYCLNEALHAWREYPQSVSGDKTKLFKYHLTIYNKYLNYSKLMSWLMFFCISLPMIFVKKTFYVQTK
jgi:glycosyltransferase involved in cell wall biosynthesis